MNIRQVLSVGAAVLLLASTPAWSGGENGNHGIGNRCQGNSCGNLHAPEIDAAAGTSAIAMLTGLVLIMRERSRSRRSSNNS